MGLHLFLQAKNLLDEAHLSTKDHRALLHVDDSTLQGEVVHPSEDPDVFDRVQTDSAENVRGDEIRCSIAFGLVRMVVENVLHLVGPGARGVGELVHASAEFHVFVSGVEVLQTAFDVRSEASESLARDDDARSTHAEVLVLCQGQFAELFFRSHARLTDVVRVS